MLRSLEDSLGRPYAQAAFNLALEQGDLPGWQDFLCALNALLENALFQSCLEVSSLDPQRRYFDLLKMLNVILDSVTDVQKAFLKELCRMDRVSVVPGVWRIFQKLRDEAEGVCRVTLESPFPVSESNQAFLDSFLSQRYQKQVVVEKKTVCSLLGGMVARVGDDVFDFSVDCGLLGLVTAVKKH